MMNDELYLDGQLELVEFSADGQPNENKTPSFTMTAYTGVPIMQRHFSAPVIVDVSGMDYAQRIPIRLDHNPEQRIGHTTEIAVVDGNIIASGLISHDNEYSRTVASSGKLGFPWQASIGAIVAEKENVAEGKTVEVNGSVYTGPLVVVRKSSLKEISFVDYGADPNTAAIVAKEMESMEDNKTVIEPEEKEVQAIESAAAPVPAAEPEKVQAKDEMEDVIKAQREAQAAELERIAAIGKVAVPGSEELQAQAIREGWNPEKFELAMLKSIKPQAAPAPAVHAKEETEFSKRTGEIIALRSCGLFSTKDEKNYSEQELEAADAHARCGLREYFELCAGMGRYEHLPNARQDTREWLHAAFDATSLPGILSNNANKVLLQGYEAVDDCWREVFKVGAVSDFKVHTRYRMNSNFVFEKVPRGGELKHGQVSEESYTQKIDTYGIMFSLTRQMIIDDDLGALFDIPFQIGLGAGQAVSDAIWSLVLANPKAADGTDFFHNKHQSLLTGTGTALSIDGLTKAEVVFRKKTDAYGRPILARPEILLVPPELLTKAELLMTATMVNEVTPESAPAPNKNPHQGKYRVCCSPYLSSPAYGAAADGDAWYLIANPVRIPSFEIAFLGGVDRPTVERADADFNTLGVQFRGYLDFGVKEQDYRGILKVAGK